MSAGADNDRRLDYIAAERFMLLQAKKLADLAAVGYGITLQDAEEYLQLRAEWEAARAAYVDSGEAPGPTGTGVGS